MRLAAVVGLIAALVAVSWSVQHAAVREGHAPVAAQGAPNSDSRATKPDATRAPRAGRVELDAIARELRDAPDLYAVYEKYREAPDPTGRISYLLAEWIGDCASYIHPTPEDMDRYFQVTPEMRRNAKRNEMMAVVVARCAGFNRGDRVLSTRLNMELWKSLHERSRQAGYPGELARSLVTAGTREPPSAKTDQTAIGLLSGSLDGEVVKHVGQYIQYRNGTEWPPYGDEGRLIWFSAWRLLECEFGADCGPRSRPVQVNCASYGYCGMTGIEDVLMVQPRMNEERLFIANELRRELAATIRNRDWVRLGFKPSTR